MVFKLQQEYVEVLRSFFEREPTFFTEVNYNYKQMIFFLKSNLMYKMYKNVDLKFSKIV